MAKHPGRILREGFLSPLGVRPSRLAAGIGVDRSTISRLLAEAQPLTPEMAARLGRFFGVPGRWFVQMQADWDAARVEGRPELVAGITPIDPHPDYLLTPSGAMRLDEPPPQQKDRPGVRTVVFDNGAVALLSDDE